MYLDTITMAEKLHGPYRDVFEKADMYRTKETAEVNDKMMDLFDMLMEAQVEEKPVERIIGNDVEGFCKTFFDEKRRYLDDINVFQWLHRIAWLVLFFVIWDFWDFYQIKEHGVSLWTIKTEVFSTFSSVMAGVVGSLIFVACLKYGLEPLIFKKKHMNPAVYNTIVLLIGIITLGVPIYYVCQLETELYVNGTWVLCLSAGYITVYLAVRSVLRYRDHGTIWKYDKAKRKAEKKELDAFNKSLSEDKSRRDTVRTMAKQYEKLKENYERNGIGVYTQEMYAKRIRRDEIIFLNPAKAWTFNFVCVVVALAYPLMMLAINDGLLIALICGSIGLVVDVLCFRFILKVVDEASKEKLDILNHCEAQGIDIVTYAENVLEQTNEHGVSYE